MLVMQLIWNTAIKEIIMNYGHERRPHVEDDFELGFENG